MRTPFLLFLLGVLAAGLFAQPLVLSIQESGERVAHEGHLDLAIAVRTPEGAPLKDAVIHARLWHIEDHGFFPTDIPYVEGEPVFEIETVAKSGTLPVLANTPIPGRYLLEVRALDAEGAYEATDASETFVVPQLPDKTVKGPLLLAFLFAVGLAGGYYFLSNRGE